MDINDSNPSSLTPRPWRPRAQPNKKVLAVVMHPKPCPVDESNEIVERVSVSSPRLVNLELLTWVYPVMRSFAPSISSACNPERPRIPPVFTGFGLALPRAWYAKISNKASNKHRHKHDRNECWQHRRKRKYDADLGFATSSAPGKK